MRVKVLCASFIAYLFRHDIKNEEERRSGVGGMIEGWRRRGSEAAGRAEVVLTRLSPACIHSINIIYSF